MSRLQYSNLKNNISCIRDIWLTGDYHTNTSWCSPTLLDTLQIIRKKHLNKDA